MIYGTVLFKRFPVFWTILPKFTPQCNQCASYFPLPLGEGQGEGKLFKLQFKWIVP